MDRFTARQTQLDAYYQQIQAVILSRQNPVSGLLPASTAVTAHGDYTDAWVRDNVYSILAVWGLALAYRKVDESLGRTYELEHSVIKLMRGLLSAMMRQADKVEKFKETQDPLDALHAKYDTLTGDVVVEDHAWGHLQLDATSLYLLMLAQMTSTGLQIVFTLDEVDFVQNLLYYIGRAYRTPDYGIWERGNKLNHGKPELNASSVGMAKAALEAMNGLNLFGVRGGHRSVVHVLPDEIARSRITLESLLPRESGSKEIDAALLSVIGFPAFAVDSDDLRQETHQAVVEKLQGRYGCKRFLRDGHQSVLEDTERLHYEPGELKAFEHIECEWPLFFSYLLLNSLFDNQPEQVAFYQARLAAVAVERDGMALLPELYYVPEAAIAAERNTPGSQRRLPNDNVPLVWAQSLYYLGQMIQAGLLTPSDLDPLARHLKVGQNRRPIVQIALLAEDSSLQQQLANYGIQTQVLAQVEPVQVRPATELSRLYEQMGRSAKLQLTGRPVHRLRSLTTARIFRIQNETAVFLPTFLDLQQFYLTLDYHFLVAQIRSELAYIHEHWNEPGRPTATLLLTHSMFELGHKPIEDSPLLQLILELQEGRCSGVPVRLGALFQLMLTAATERLAVGSAPLAPPMLSSYTLPVSAYLRLSEAQTQPLTLLQELDLERETDTAPLLQALKTSDSLYEQIELLSNLTRLAGLTYDTGWDRTEPVTLARLLDEVYVKAGRLETWDILRRAAGLLNKVDISLSEAVTELLVRQKQIAVGKAYSRASLITDPLPPHDIVQKISEFCGEDSRDRVLTQEILIYLSVLIKAEPELFDGLLTLRVSYLILLLTSELGREQQLTQAEAYEALMQLSPFDIKMRLRRVLVGYEGLNRRLFQQESLQAQPLSSMQWVLLPQAEAAPDSADSWWQKRQLEGSLNRVPADFYPRVWQTFKHCHGIVIGDKLERRNRLVSQVILSDTTAEETDFARRIDHLLNKIQAPEYRQINVEALMELSELFARNPSWQIEDDIVLDVLIGHAVRLAWLEADAGRADRYDQDKASAWRSFYQRSPHTCARYLVKAMQFLIELGKAAPANSP
ncbi:MAG: glycosyl hydrolase family 15 [Leptolyngbya sp. SIO4C1]|nr:glycosyl hydrolase family 15 [Leptolyngbya sp. SIO4C1]